MNAEPAQPSPLSPISPVQQIQIGTGQNHGALNQNKNCFNVIHIHCSCADGCHQIRRGVSSLASIVEDPSCDPFDTGQTAKCSRWPHDITQVQGQNIDQEYEHAGIPFELNSEVSIDQALASQARHGSVKSQSLFSVFANISVRFSRTVLGLPLQPTSLQRPKLYTELNTENVKKYLPKRIHKKYKNYIRSPHLEQVTAIPIWNPRQTRGVDVRGRVRIDVGDVGTFTMRGGFRVAFNILLDEKTNKSCGYNLPKNFSRFGSCYIKDDGKVIDLDNCGAIHSEAADCRDALHYGIKQTPCKSSQDRCSPLFEISPQATKDNRRGYIYLPYGAKIYTFSPIARQNLRPYLNAQLPNWREYLDELWEEQQAPPIILTAVWAARSFACATYKLSPPNTSATLRLSRASKGEKVEWAEAPEGFATEIAPMSEGYDKDGKLMSGVENQCFAIEGYAIR